MADIIAHQETVNRCLAPSHAKPATIPLGHSALLLAMHTGNTLAGRFLAHRILLSVCGLFLLAGIALSFLVDKALPFAKGIDFAAAIASCLILSGFGILIYRFGMTQWSDRYGALGRITKNMVLSPRWTNAVPALLSLSVLVVVLNAIVAWLPEIGMHSDATNLIAMDRAFHLGVLPDEIAYTFAGSTVLTVFLDQLYQISLLCVLAFYVTIACAKHDTPIRQQFLISISLAWVAGALLMLLMSSTGPAFSIQMNTGNTAYADLFSRLAAMPSLVTASLAIATLTAFGIRNSLGILACAMLLISSIAAVHLGWNYAIDCYAGAFLGFVAWKAGGWMMLKMA